MQPTTSFKPPWEFYRKTARSEIFGDSIGLSERRTSKISSEAATALASLLDRVLEFGNVWGDSYAPPPQDSGILLLPLSPEKLTDVVQPGEICPPTKPKAEDSRSTSHGKSGKDDADTSSSEEEDEGMTAKLRQSAVTFCSGSSTFTPDVARQPGLLSPPPPPSSCLTSPPSESAT